jgi:hypothetical protein
VARGTLREGGQHILPIERSPKPGQSHLNHCIRSSLDYWPNP